MQQDLENSTAITVQSEAYYEEDIKHKGRINIYVLLPFYFKVLFITYTNIIIQER